MLLASTCCNTCTLRDRDSHIAMNAEALFEHLLHTLRIYARRFSSTSVRMPCQNADVEHWFTLLCTIP
jgi:hypothetical protein